MRNSRAGAGRARPQRARLFVGCEGASERGYVGLLADFSARRRLQIHLDVAILNPGAGDPRELVKRAVIKARRSAELHGEHEGRFLLLDSDRHDPEADLGRRTVALAREGRLALVWQDPCHEALLLRHLPACRDRRPLTTPDAEADLKRLWPEYEKGMSHQRLSSRIDEAAVLRVAEVESGLRELLLAIGLMRHGTSKGRG